MGFACCVMRFQPRRFSSYFEYSIMRSSMTPNHTKALGKVTLPIHLKLVQCSGRIQVFTSPDGHQWGEPRMTHEGDFDGENRLAFFVCSGNTFSSTTAVF